MSKIENDIKIRIEGVLDNGFPKIEEEGPEKIANKRGPALVLFACAMMEIRQLIKAFGGCTLCYGKGYSTQQVKAEGDDPRMITVYNSCTCDRGKQIDKLKLDVNGRL